MKTIASLALATILAVLLAPGVSSATTVSECQAQIAALSAATSAATFARDEQGLKAQEQLIHHLEKASAHLEEGAYRDALHQLRNYSRVLDNAVESGRLSADAGAPLAAAAASIVECIEAIE